MIGGAYRLGPLSARATAIVLGAAGLLIALIAWQIAAIALDSELLLPSLPAVFGQLVGLVADPALSVNLMDTLYRIVFGFVVGSAIGLVLGATIGSFAIVRQFVNPYLNFLRAITPAAWIVPATIWLGIGTPAILFVVVYSAAFPVAINTISGMAAVPRNKVRMARMFGLGPLGIFLKILIPNAVPYVIVGARLSLGFSFMAVVGSEMLVGQTGLGFIIYNARIFFDTAIMYPGIVILGILGFLGDRLFVLLQKTVFGRYYAGRI